MLPRSTRATQRLNRARGKSYEKIPKNLGATPEWRIASIVVPRLQSRFDSPVGIRSEAQVIAAPAGPLIPVESPDTCCIEGSGPQNQNAQKQSRLSSE